ncbi:MAG: hypothetical protein VST68_08065 [Nitrospirota bacterium]|nr:hypothetical protein [Nitrospirota bacterium]
MPHCNICCFRFQVLLLCLFLQVGGCLSDRRDPIPDWEGLHERELVEMMGPPTERVALPGGKVQLIFDQGRLDPHAGTHESWTCRVYFETDSRGFVQGVSSSGC